MPPAAAFSRAPALLRLDALAGGLVGVLVLALSGWLAEFTGLPRGLLVFTGAANLAYAAYSGSLVLRRRRPLRLVALLAVANMAWGGVCVALAATYGADANAFGLLHLLGEAAFVGGLGAVEWRRRYELATP